MKLSNIKIKSAAISAAISDSMIVKAMANIEHPMVLIHLMTILVLAVSSFLYAGFEQQSLFIVYLVAFGLTMFFLRRSLLLAGRSLHNYMPDTRPIIGKVQGASLVFIFLYPALFIYDFGAVPLFSVMATDDYYGIARFRGSLTYDMPAWHGYLKAYYAKAIAPFFLVYLFHTRSKWFWPVLCVSAFFALNMIAKLYITVLLLPLVIYFFGRKMWGKAAITLISLLLFLNFLVYVTNPVIQVQNTVPCAGHEITKRNSSKSSDIPTCENTVRPKESVYSIWGALQSRLLKVPGRVINDWTTIIPDQIPYLKGCGNRLLAVFRGCDYVYIPALIYKKANPDLVDKHQMRGAENSAHFINGYANFGYYGIALSGILTCLVLIFLEALFSNKLFFVSLSFAPTLMLTSTTLSSTLHTGGLVLVTVLYLLMRSRFEEGGSKGTVENK